MVKKLFKAVRVDSILRPRGVENSGKLGPVDPSHEAAAAKFWAVYVSEAEKYDKGLVESWKSDMEGILIFAGLFSASLTAFLIESYKTLSPDSADRAVMLLEQVSQQMAAAANGTNFTISTSAPFTPLRTSMFCNCLWFISLGLALTSALVATLVEQWARDFLHRTEIRSAPVIRARMFSFLYYGLKRFKMHAVVELIPLLLHASLLLFFVGLVAFLVPVNTAVTALAGILLLIISSVYLVLTLIPLFHLDSPYRTPLSGAFWRLKRFSTSFRSRKLPASNAKLYDSDCTDKTDTIVDSIFREATEVSNESAARDKQALVWTVKSLTDNAELEPFIEALPDVLWGPNKRRYIYDDHIRELVNNPDVDLNTRITTLYESCDSGLISDELSQRRRTSCYKAIWAIGSLSLPGSSPLPYAYVTWSWPDEDETSSHYRTSARAMEQWGNFHAAQNVLREALKMLAQWISQPGDLTDAADEALPSRLRRLERYGIDSHMHWGFHPIPSFNSTKETTLSDITGLMVDFEELPQTQPMRILMSYLRRVAALKSSPYQFQTTCQIISPVKLPLSKRLMAELRQTLHDVSDLSSRRQPKGNEDDHSWNLIVQLIQYWNPAETDGQIGFPGKLMQYMNECNDSVIWNRFCSAFPRSAWATFTITISDGPWEIVEDDAGIPPLELTLTFLWNFLGSLRLNTPMDGDLGNMEAILHAISRAQAASITQSVVAVVKLTALQIIHFSYWETAVPDRMARFWHPILPSDTAIQEANTKLNMDENQLGEEAHPNPFPKFIDQRWQEGLLHVTIELIESCLSKDLPSMVDQALRRIGNFEPNSNFLPNHQMRFAMAIKNLSDTWIDADHEGATTILLSIPSLKLFNAYRPSTVRVPRLLAWMDNPEARNLIKEAFTTYLGKIPSEYSELFREICTNLDLLHPESRQCSPDVVPAKNVILEVESSAAAEPSPAV
ncbi:hypothetical protein C8R43DRAFT_1238928 [Mycena crocata]|nr:hypothetical protein C8R43DRAFT_1238928 [Mycena crocata]